MLRFLVAVFMLLSCAKKCITAKGDSGKEYTLDSVRASLVRQEDTIVFGVIERTRFPLNSPTYQQSYIPHFSGSLLDFIVDQTEAIQSKGGRYINPEENAFTENLPPSIVPHYNFSQILHNAAALININKDIRKMYLNEMLPLFVATGDDGNYAERAASDLSLLQAISRRIHYGKFVAEAKFRKSPQDYEPLIRAQNKEALMKLLTSKSVEDEVIKRVEKKAKMFGQEVTLDRDVKRKYKNKEALMRLLTSKSVEDEVIKRVEKKAKVFGQEVTLDRDVKGKYKVDPSVVSHLYQNWIITPHKNC